MSLYNLKSLTADTYAIAKFDADFNVEAVYNLTPSRNGQFSCDCPANNRTVILKPCKHRRMLPLMLGAVNTDRFYDPDTGTWHEPLGDLLRPAAADLEGREALSDEPYTTEEIEALPDGLEKDFHRAMQDANEAAPTPASAPTSAQPLIIRRR